MLSLASFLAAALVFGLPVSAAPLIDDVPDKWQPAADVKMPVPPQQELNRRWSAAPENVKDEPWYKKGKRAFMGRCAGCHIKEAEKMPQRLLTKDNLESSGFLEDQNKIRYLIRYGGKSHPGYAADCSDLGELSQCNAAVPLDEEVLQSLQDYMLNRAGVAWKTLG